MAKIMHSGHKESEQDEKQSYSQGHGYVETLERKPTLQPGIPLRASAHPSALAAVRPKYPRSSIDLERITHLDVAGLPTLPQSTGSLPPGVTANPTKGPVKSGVSQRKTDDLFIEPTFHNKDDIVPIDEIDTHPPDIQMGRGSGLKQAASDPSTLLGMDTLPVVSLERRTEETSQQVRPRQLAATQLPIGLEQTAQPQEFFTGHYFDNVCWWLLSPGRLEFLLCLIGGIVLVCLTSFFLLIVMVNLGLCGL
jgi:hypothetical protein